MFEKFKRAIIDTKLENPNQVNIEKQLLKSLGVKMSWSKFT